MNELRPWLYFAVVAALILLGPAGALLALLALAVNEFIALMVNLRDDRLPRSSRLRAWFGWAGRLYTRYRHWRGSYHLGKFPAYDKAVSDLAWGRYSRRDFDVLMRKRLLRAATVRLADRHGVDLDRQPERARQLLGEHAWLVLAPEQAPSQDRSRGGVDVQEVERVVAAIEAL
ncbi:hypothetical protein [Flindersiella endophytica]